MRPMVQRGAVAAMVMAAGAGALWPGEAAGTASPRGQNQQGQNQQGSGGQQGQQGQQGQSTTTSPTTQPAPAPNPSPPSTGTTDTTAGASGGGDTLTSPALVPAAVTPAHDAAVAAPVSGTVTVTVPGHRSEALVPGAALPAGTVIDATRGRVRLSSPNGGRPGVFTAGRFVVGRTTGAHPRTTLRLVGGTFSGCPATRAGHATAGGKPKRRRSRHAVVRQLWGSDHHGQFLTNGRFAAAEVRGTVWLTQDRCDGTRVVVRAGAVLVRDRTRHRNVLVRAGHSYLAPAR